MEVKQEIQKLLQNLHNQYYGNIVIGGSEITVRLNDQGNTFFLTTPVYFGGNYIPKSVRNCINTPQPFNVSLIKTELVVNEEKFEINLSYTDLTQHLNSEKFMLIIEEFAFLADEWRLLLDEQDRNDRLHIYAR